MSDKTPLPIDRAPAPRRLALEELVALNLALARAQVADRDATIAATGARELAASFVRLRAELSAKHGAQLGGTHGWDELTGEIREVRNA